MQSGYPFEYILIWDSQIMALWIIINKIFRYISCFASTLGVRILQYVGRCNSKGIIIFSYHFPKLMQKKKAAESSECSIGLLLGKGERGKDWRMRQSQLTKLELVVSVPKLFLVCAG